MITLLALIRKDLRIFFQDRRAVIMSFVAPILIGSFFGYVFGGQSRSEEQGKVNVVVVDQENGTVSRQIVDALRKEPSLQISEDRLDTARELIRKGEGSGGGRDSAGFRKKGDPGSLPSGRPAGHYLPH